MMIDNYHHNNLKANFCY